MPTGIAKLNSRRVVYQLRVTLMGSEPPIWRRMLVASDMPLHSFHEALQTVMGWHDCHLHQFIAGDACYGMPDPDFPSGMKSEARVKVRDILPDKGASAIYEYDFGDAWEHELLVEDILPWPDEPLLPRCLDGDRACPPEDCGGMPGYAALLEGIADSAPPEHAEMREWLDESFDPKAFEPSIVNFQLGRALGR